MLRTAVTTEATHCIIHHQAPVQLDIHMDRQVEHILLDTPVDSVEDILVDLADIQVDQQAVDGPSEVAFPADRHLHVQAHM